MYFTGEPLYPFGHGLSFTTFSYSNVKLSSSTLKKDATLTVRVQVRNSGKRPGEEVVQLYAQFPKSAVERPLKELKGFQRISLKPGEAKTVQIPLKAESLAWWNEKKNGWDLEPGTVNLLIGASSADIRLRTNLRLVP